VQQKTEDSCEVLVSSRQLEGLSGRRSCLTSQAEGLSSRKRDLGSQKSPLRHERVQSVPSLHCVQGVSTGARQHTTDSAHNSYSTVQCSAVQVRVLQCGTVQYTSKMHLVLPWLYSSAARVTGETRLSHRVGCASALTSQGVRIRRGTECDFFCLGPHESDDSKLRAHTPMNWHEKQVQAQNVQYNVHQ